MLKEKILNLRLLVFVGICVFVISLIPLGLQAFAVNNEEIPSVSNGQNIIVKTDTEKAWLYTKDNQTEFALEDSDEVIYTGDICKKDNVGVLYVKHSDNTIEVLADTFAYNTVGTTCFKFEAWNVSEQTDGSTTYTATFSGYTPGVDDMNGYYAGRVLYEESYGNDIPVEGAEITWVNSITGGYITRYTDELGFVSVPVPLGIPGSFHVIKDGYVSDYSQNITMDATDFPVSLSAVRLVKGAYTTVKSNSSTALFHVREWIGPSGTQGAGEVTEDVYLSELPTRMLPDGALLAVLSDEECEKYNVRPGTLYYYYHEKGMGTPVYEISFEPSENLEIENWVFTNGKGQTEVMVIDKDYKITIDDGPFTFALNYVLPPDPEDPTPEQPGSNASVTGTSQTGDYMNYACAIFTIVAIAGVCGLIISIKRKKLN